MRIYINNYVLINNTVCQLISVTYEEDGKGVTVRDSTEGDYAFAFDQVFQENCTQEEVYKYAAKPVVTDMIEGYNSTILVYGMYLIYVQKANF